MKVEYTLLSLAEEATIEACFNANKSRKVSTKDLVFHPDGQTKTKISYFDVSRFNGDLQEIQSESFGAPLLNDDELGLKSFLHIDSNIEGDIFSLSSSVLLGNLTNFCDETNKILIQCQPAKRLQLVADHGSRAADDELVNSIATVVSSGAGFDYIANLTAPPGFDLSCNISEASEIFRLTMSNREGGHLVYADTAYIDHDIQNYLIRTVPLSVGFRRANGETGKVDALCPVAIDCLLPERAPRPVFDPSPDNTSIARPPRPPASTPLPGRDDFCPEPLLFEAAGNLSTLQDLRLPTGLHPHVIWNARSISPFIVVALDAGEDGVATLSVVDLLIFGNRVIGE